MEKDGMEKDIIKKVILILKLKKEMEKEKNMMVWVHYYLKENI